MSDPQSSPTLDSAVALHQSGKLEAAAKAYRRILEQRPEEAHALHLLGVVHVQRAEPDEGATLIEQAISLQPNVGTYHLNLAWAYRAMRRVDDAIAEAEKAIALDAAGCGAGGYHVAGLAFADAGQFDDAIYCFEKSLAAMSSAPAGVRRDTASDDAGVRLLLAQVLDRAGRLQESAAAFDAVRETMKQHVEREPESGQAHLQLARFYESRGQLDDAVIEYRTASQKLGSDPGVFLALGQVLQFQGKRDEALTCYQLALRINPRFAEAHAAAGRVLIRQNRFAEAVAALRTAISLAPLHPEMHAQLAAALAQVGEVDEALAVARRAVAEHAESSPVHGALLRLLPYASPADPGAAFREHLHFADRHADALAETVAPFDLPLDPDRPLRIGLVSPDLRDHPIGRTILHLLENADPSAYQFVCYCDAAETDDVSARIKQRSLGWLNTVGWSDQALAGRVRQDRIDILLDLAGHSETSRMLLFARKPAPVQASYLGSPGGTTGLRTVDWRITDATCDPPGRTEQWHTEKLHRLPRPAWCYRPHLAAPRIEQRRENESPVFISLNDLPQLSADTLATWARVLEAAPTARLMVLTPFRDPADFARKLAARGGIDPVRVAALPLVSPERLMDVLGQADVALDAFPVSTTTATGDALHMGVPTVTLAGATYAARVGATLMEAVGLGELIAATTDDYVRIAADLANDRTRRASLRHALRERLRQSPLSDTAGFATAMQDFFRAAWRDYCTSAGGNSVT